MKPKNEIKTYSRAIRHWLPVIILGAIILFLSVARVGPSSEIRLTFHDKVNHFFFYGFLATLIFRGLGGSSNALSRWLIAFAAAASFGLLDETLQHFNPSRQGDPLDWIADCMGALTGIFAYRCAALYRNLLEFSPLLWVWQRR